MIEIPLTQGFFALIDDEDAHLAQHKWYAQHDPCGLVYARRWAGTVDGKQVPQRLHREVMGATDRAILVDHIDGDGLNCRRSNLRLASASLNSRNRGGRKYLGVTARHGKFRARIRYEGKPVQIGTFETEEEAYRARLAFENEKWGQEARGARQ